MRIVISEKMAHNKGVLKTDRRDNHLISTMIMALGSPRQNLGWEIGSPETRFEMGISSRDFLQEERKGNREGETERD